MKYGVIGWIALVAAFGLVLAALVLIASVMAGALSAGNLLIVVPLLLYAGAFYGIGQMDRLNRKMVKDRIDYERKAQRD